MPVTDLPDYSAEAPTPTSKFLAYADTLITIPTATSTRIPFDGKYFDVLSEYDKVTNYQFTAETEGYYLLIVSVHWNEAEIGKEFQISLWKTGGTYTPAVRNTPSNADEFEQSIQAIIHLNAHESAYVIAWHNCSTSKTIANGVSRTRFCGTKLS